MAARVLARHGKALGLALSAQFREEIREQGLSQAEVARRMGVTRQSVTLALADGIQTLGVASVMADALGYTLVLTLEPTDSGEATRVERYCEWCSASESEVAHSGCPSRPKCQRQAEQA